MSPRLEAVPTEPGMSSGADRIGSKLGPYRVVGRLGAGGMGEVYEVEHEALGRRFALKMLLPHLKEDTETLTRFHREPRAAAKLVSEHIVSIVDAGALADGTPYFVMERLYGTDLRRLLNQQSILPVARVAHIGVDACRGLACAHRAGLVHRDLKPENLFLTTHDDGQDLCKLLDFGVVKSATDNTTRPGAMLGTARYMAPEQLGLDVPVSPQTDLFALGVILYECLVGHSPFSGDTVERVLFKIMTEQALPVRELRPEVPEAFSELLSRALSKAPEDRPESALVFAEALLPFARPALTNRAFSNWQLQVSEGAHSEDLDRDLTARNVEPARVTTARTQVLSGERQTVTRMSVSLALGLTLGALATWLSFFRAPGAASPPQKAEKPAALPIVTAPRAGSLSVTPNSNPSANAAPTPSAVPSAPSTVPSAPSPTPGPVQSPRSNRAKQLASALPAAASAAPAPPPASYDPLNPYAP